MTRDWRPVASPRALRLRAAVLASVRDFFAERDVLEVETPLLAAATVTDLHLHSFSVVGAGGPVGFLQTSPEYAMKRLLAAGSGSIYQITRSFRDQERGSLHNREFTLLEWYRVGWDHHRLMTEVADLVDRLLGCGAARRVTYRELFLEHLQLDPLTSSLEQLRSAVTERLPGAPRDGDRDELLALLLTHCIEPRLELGRALFVHDFPASQAALARLRDDGTGPAVAERFELYVGRTELANGFHELADAREQRHRFERDLEHRRRLGLLTPPTDEALLEALAHGLPHCAGVALGLDRLIQLKAGAARIEEVLAFPQDRA